jgi:hypothetical protein
MQHKYRKKNDDWHPVYDGGLTWEEYEFSLIEAMNPDDPFCLCEDFERDEEEEKEKLNIL